MAFIYDLTDTWNAGGTTFSAIKMNVTDTASASASKLITVQVGGAEKFGVRKDGLTYVAGSLGVGTSSPSYRLDIPATGAVAANLGGILTGANGTDIVGTIGPLSLQASGANYVGFTTASAERMRITGTGNVGIGTSSPSQKLTVAGNIELFQGADRFIKLGSSTNYNYTLSAVGDDFQILEAGTTPRLTIKYPNGNVGIGTSSPAGKLGVYTLSGVGQQIQVGEIAPTVMQFRNSQNVGGSITIVSGGGTSYNTSSDYRLKNIDGPLSNSGAYIDALKPVQGSWKADGSRFIGLLAHEVQEVSETQIATGEKDGEEMQAMDYSSPELIANLIAEIQSMRLRLAQLEG
jgi:hypothetical protein